jgi:hypothetical protein
MNVHSTIAQKIFCQENNQQGALWTEGVRPEKCVL